MRAAAGGGLASVIFYFGLCEGYLVCIPVGGIGRVDCWLDFVLDVVAF